MNNFTDFEPSLKEKIEELLIILKELGDVEEDALFLRLDSDTSIVIQEVAL